MTTEARVPVFVRAARVPVFVRGLLLLAASGCGSPDAPPLGGGPTTTRPEPYRPQLHFSPLAGFMNDPNGLAYFGGEYHLFFQHNPASTFFGAPHWGHAVSADALRWQPLDTALSPDPALGWVFSGSAVVTHGPASAACPDAGDCLAAVFTHHGGSDATEKQSVAFSSDGRTFVPWAQNPVLPNQGVADFRDPKVFWHDDSQAWVVVVAADRELEVYRSSDLLSWTLASALAPPGVPDATLECPDLFPLAAADGVHWVLKADVNHGLGVAEPSAYYLLGDFDGTTFAPTTQASLLDRGLDFYAAQSWSSTPDASRMWLAWMSNWGYALSTPTQGWRGAMTLPRKLSLLPGPGGAPALAQQPVDLSPLRRQKLVDVSQLDLATAASSRASARGTLLEVEVELPWSAGAALELAVRVGASERTVFGADMAAAGAELYVDRTQAGRASFSPDFAARHTAPLQPTADGAVRLHAVIDWASLELFAQDGLLVFSEQIYPALESDGLELSGTAGTTLTRLTVWELASIWSP